MTDDRKTVPGGDPAAQPEGTSRVDWSDDHPVLRPDPNLDETDAEYDAHLDPWCLAPLTSGATILFGYALEHPFTAGLAWLSSSEIAALDIPRHRAGTRSGRRYRLGRRFDVMDVGAEGEEARLVFDLLVGDAFTDMDLLRDLDEHWVASLKMSRHLTVDPPARSWVSINEFKTRYLDLYVALRASFRVSSARPFHRT